MRNMPMIRIRCHSEAALRRKNPSEASTKRNYWRCFVEGAYGSFATAEVASAQDDNPFL
jgi:hypothetical protein